ncbi:hypothetical protein L207DRAFT_113371 [Hyaloscypha variabilis F]|uniref:Secreted protein n=1 Tax=Hyaloscypha variabilis (strain UAMH 11265 / GT02V1 / F) TaxID=1149755 RepID=A0A2J6RA09_HYAVF|nr:hypothetical protein L207DRAFT_113371 [Hyaloscypha variabilis F]
MSALDNFERCLGFLAVVLPMCCGDWYLDGQQPKPSQHAQRGRFGVERRGTMCCVDDVFWITQLRSYRLVKQNHQASRCFITEIYLLHLQKVQLPSLSLSYPQLTPDSPLSSS